MMIQFIKSVCYGCCTRRAKLIPHCIKARMQKGPHQAPHGQPIAVRSEKMPNGVPSETDRRASNGIAATFVDEKCLETSNDVEAKIDEIHARLAKLESNEPENSKLKVAAEVPQNYTDELVYALADRKGSLEESLSRGGTSPERMDSLEKRMASVEAALPQPRSASRNTERFREPASPKAALLQPRSASRNTERFREPAPPEATLPQPRSASRSDSAEEFSNPASPEVLEWYRREATRSQPRSPSRRKSASPLRRAMSQLESDINARIYSLERTCANIICELDNVLELPKPLQFAANTKPKAAEQLATEKTCGSWATEIVLKPLSDSAIGKPAGSVAVSPENGMKTWPRRHEHFRVRGTNVVIEGAVNSLKSSLPSSS